MVSTSIAERVEKLWDTWNIRVLIILSLLLQSFLILFAPLRRQGRAKWIVMILIWLAYLLADWVATFTIGLILRAERSDILAFWAPFLLLHLGGPDTITSFSLEDNEFWIRHLLGLLLQIGSTVYVIYQSLPQNMLLIPTFLVLIAGIIKYVERNRAFYLACFDHYGGKGVNHADMNWRMEGLFNRRWEREKLLTAPNATIKNLLVGPLLSYSQRSLNREAFLGKHSKDVLWMLEIELSLLYEALHTKLPVVHCKIGYLFRIISLGCIFGALLSFKSISKHYHQVGKFEIRLTYGLLIGAITLDFISIGFLIYSDFNLAKYSFGVMPESQIMANRSRWSKTIPQYNFITYCVNDHPDRLNKLADFLHIRNILEVIKGMQYLSSQDLGQVPHVWHFIHEEVQEKARNADTVDKGKEIIRKRGEGILDSQEKYKDLIWSIKELDYMESLLTWHLATELCFHDLDNSPTRGDIYYRAISKLLSDYMLYLVEMQPTIMSTVSFGWKEVRKRAYDEIKCFFNNNPSSLYDVNNVSKAVLRLDPDRVFMCPPPACYDKPAPVFLYFAHKLAWQLNELNGWEGFPWELMSKVWVELMCYAAINCRPNVHAQQPGKGGQLLTIVWLLMNHLGLGTQFSTQQIQSGGIIGESFLVT